MSTQRTIHDDAAMFLGLPPHDGFNNPCAGDGYFAIDCERHWGEIAWNKACDEVRTAGRAAQPATTAPTPARPTPANTGNELTALRELAADLANRLEQLHNDSQPVYRLLLRGPCGSASDLFMALDDLHKAHHGIKG